MPYFDHKTYSMSAYEEVYEKIHQFYIKENHKYSEIVFVLNHAWELTQADQLLALHKFFKKKFKILDIQFYIVFSISLDSTENLPKNIIKYNFFQNKTVHASTAGNQPLSKNWNGSVFRGLLLTGKPNKLQRIYPIKELSDRNLLTAEYMEWSFHYKQIYLTDIAEMLNVSETDAQVFAQLVNRNPDNIDTSQYTTSFDYDGIPYDQCMYSNTSWSLISETTTHPHATWLTEKTYRAILNKHPFIFFAQPFTEQFLKSINFRTFDYCFPVKYDIIEDEKQRFDAAIENVVFLKNNWNSLDFERICADVEYNYNVLLNNTSNAEQALVKQLAFSDGDCVCDIDDKQVSGRSLEKLSNNEQHILYYKWF